MNFTNTHTASIIPFIPFTSTRNDDAPDSVNTQSPANFVTNDQLYSTNSTTVDIGYSYFSAATQPPFKATTFDQFPNSPVTYSDPLTSQHSNVTVRSHSIESPQQHLHLLGTSNSTGLQSSAPFSLLPTSVSPIVENQKLSMQQQSSHQRPQLASSSHPSTSTSSPSWPTHTSSRTSLSHTSSDNHHQPESMAMGTEEISPVKPSDSSLEPDESSKSQDSDFSSGQYSLNRKRDKAHPAVLPLTAADSSRTSNTNNSTVEMSSGKPSSLPIVSTSSSSEARSSSYSKKPSDLCISKPNLPASIQPRFLAASSPSTLSPQKRKGSSINFTISNGRAVVSTCNVPSSPLERSVSLDSTSSSFQTSPSNFSDSSNSEENLGRFPNSSKLRTDNAIIALKQVIARSRPKTHQQTRSRAKSVPAPAGSGVGLDQVDLENLVTPPPKKRICSSAVPSPQAPPLSPSVLPSPSTGLSSPVSTASTSGITSVTYDPASPKHDSPASDRGQSPGTRYTVTDHMRARENQRMLQRHNRIQQQHELLQLQEVHQQMQMQFEQQQFIHQRQALAQQQAPHVLHTNHQGFQSQQIVSQSMEGMISLQQTLSPAIPIQQEMVVMGRDFSQPVEGYYNVTYPNPASQYQALPLGNDPLQQQQHQQQQQQQYFSGSPSFVPMLSNPSPVAYQINFAQQQHQQQQLQYQQFFQLQQMQLQQKSFQQSQYQFQTHMQSGLTTSVPMPGASGALLSEVPNPSSPNAPAVDTSTVDQAILE